MIAGLILAASLTAGGGAVPAIAPPVMPVPTPLLRTYFMLSLCRTSEVTITLPASYDAPAWDDAIGAQVGVWTHAGDPTPFAFSYEEDGLAYASPVIADICPVYREV